MREGDGVERKGAKRVGESRKVLSGRAQGDCFQASLSLAGAGGVYSFGDMEY